MNPIRFITVDYRHKPEDMQNSHRDALHNGLRTAMYLNHVFNATTTCQRIFTSEKLILGGNKLSSKQSYVVQLDPVFSQYKIP